MPTGTTSTVRTCENGQTSAELVLDGLLLPEQLLFRALKLAMVLDKCCCIRLRWTQHLHALYHTDDKLMMMMMMMTAMPSLQLFKYICKFSYDTW